jgi:hypothetical protein
VKKRRQGQLVQLKIRIRERLRERLEYAARQEEIPLSHEIVRRLENSFDQQQLFVLLEYMLAPGMSMDLFKALASILAHRPNWQESEFRHATATAIYKVIAVYIGELSPGRESFPEATERGSADQSAWDALFELRESLRPKVKSPDEADKLAADRAALLQAEGKRAWGELAKQSREPELPMPQRSAKGGKP